MAVVLVVDADLLARARVEEAARAAGVSVRGASSGEEGAVGDDVSLIVLDLDRGRDEALAFARRARDGGFTGAVVGFYSHVDEALGTAAEAAGVRALPRGRFWRELSALLQS